MEVWMHKEDGDLYLYDPYNEEGLVDDDDDGWFIFVQRYIPEYEATVTLKLFNPDRTRFEVLGDL
jgi:hypothetical protein